MIDFMVVSMPRSRSTWLANWLTTDKSICLHDPLRDKTIKDIEAIKADKVLGVADTSLLLYGDKLNRYRCKKLIIHRSLAQVSRSVGEKIDARLAGQLNGIKGLHIQYDEINAMGREIWRYLIGDGFDQERFNLLKDMNIEPHFPGLKRASQNAIRRAAVFI